MKDIKTVCGNFYEIIGKFPEVRYVGDPILRQETEDVSLEEGYKIGKRLGEVLMRYRGEVGYGRGFAAPQIGEGEVGICDFRR
ncbi:peptide deformylase [bacterium]|nr:peptide deformylase [bacterium]